MSNLVPEGWLVKKVGEFTKEHKQGYYTKNSYNDHGTYLIRITDLNNPKIDYTNMPRLPIDESEFNQFKVDIGDFLFARSGAIGRYGIVKKNYLAVFASYLIRFRFDNSMVSTRYFGYAYESDICQSQISAITQGSSNININADNIKSLSVPFPPLPEQQKIAAILTSVDEVIEKTQAQIDKLKDLKTAMMQELLTRGVGVDGKPHTEFKDSPVGRIPKGWEVKVLTDIADNLDSKRVPIKSAERASIQGQYRYYGASGIIDYVNDFIFNGEYILLGEDGENVLSRNLPLAFIVSGKFWVNNHAHVLSAKQGTDMKYLCEYLESIDYSNIASGSAQPKITKGALNALKIPVPTYDEQVKIGSVLNSIDIKVLAIQEKLISLKSTKKALMQDLLTGKVRVTVPAAAGPEASSLKAG